MGALSLYIETNRWVLSVALSAWKLLPLGELGDMMAGSGHRQRGRKQCFLSGEAKMSARPALPSYEVSTKDSDVCRVGSDGSKRTLTQRCSLVSIGRCVRRVRRLCCFHVVQIFHECSTGWQVEKPSACLDNRRCFSNGVTRGTRCSLLKPHLRQRGKSLGFSSTSIQRCDGNHKLQRIPLRWVGPRGLGKY